jgi:Tfp pilus assembly protein PilF
MRQLLICLIASSCLCGSLLLAEQSHLASSTDVAADFKAGAALVSRHIKMAEREPAVDAIGRQALEEGIARLEAVVRADSQHWQASWFIGKAYQALGNRLAANGAFKTAYLIEQNNPDIASEYGLSCIDLGQGMEGIAALQRAIKLSPSEPGLHANLALAYLVANRNKQALDSANRAISMNPADKVSHAVRALVMQVIEGKRPQPKSGAEF